MCFEIDQEVDAILLIIDIVYGVCRIIIKSVQQCTYFLFSVNLLLVGVFDWVDILSTHYGLSQPQSMAGCCGFTTEDAW